MSSWPEPKSYPSNLWIKFYKICCLILIPFVFFSISLSYSFSSYAFICCSIRVLLYVSLFRKNWRFFRLFIIPLFFNPPSLQFFLYKTDDRFSIEILAAFDIVSNSAWLLLYLWAFFNFLLEVPTTLSFWDLCDWPAFDLGVWFSFKGSVIEGQLWVLWWGFLRGDSNRAWDVG